MLADRLRYHSRLSSRWISALVSHQRRWAQVHDVRFLVTHEKADKFTEKYRHKLQQKAIQAGLRSIDELKSVYKDRIQVQRKKSAANVTHDSPSPPPATIPKDAASATNPIASPSPQQITAAVKPSVPAGLKTLSSYLNLPKTLTLPPKEIEYIWRLRHASSPTSLCAVLPSSTYSRIRRTAYKHPQFILPLPRQGASGAEIHFLQWSFPEPNTSTVVFTHLAEYKLRGEYSQPHTTLTMHTELQDRKGLVLMQGQVVEGRGISVDEARWLVLCLQRFYGEQQGRGTSRKKLLGLFSEGDDAFTVEELVKEAEKLV
ncbi:MAG: hypothetical protein LQ350_007913 [Teloschistes chrysophthalmus]|nr:MAG: hypothetical protein LQ350_007913 [Niorma chrysophthalma]